MSSLAQTPKKDRHKSRRRGLRYWIAIGAVAAYTAVGSKTVALVYAQHSRGELEASQNQTKSLPVRRFDIPPGLLDEVLNAFQTVTGLRVLVPSDAIRSLTSPGVSGLFTVEQALQQLLTDTGLRYQFTATDEVTLEIAGPVGFVEVRAAEPVVQISSPKYTAPLRD